MNKRKMSLDDAIEHAQIIVDTREDMYENCREELQQVADWLRELKQYRLLRNTDTEVVAKINKLQKECDDKERYTIELYNRAKDAEEEIKNLQNLLAHFDKFGDIMTPIGLLPVNADGMRKLVDAYNDLKRLYEFYNCILEKA